MSAFLLPNGKQQFLDSNGDPLAGGDLYFYIPTTTTFKSTWQDSAQTILNTNPVVLDAAGEALIYGLGTYRQVVKDIFGTTIWDQLTASGESYSLLIPDRATLAGISDFTNVTPIFDGSTWAVVPYSSVSAQVTADTAQGLFVRSTVDTSQVWKRVYTQRVAAVWFGAMGVNSVTDSATLTSCLAAVSAIGGSEVQLPGGNVYIDTVSIPSNVGIYGKGRDATTVIVPANGNNGFVIGNGVTLVSETLIAELTMTGATTTKSGGAFIRINDAYATIIRDVKMTFPYYGIDILDGQVTRIEDVDFISAANVLSEYIRLNGSQIVNHSSSNTLLMNVAGDGAAAPFPRTGLKIGHHDGLFMVQSQFNRCNLGMILEPAATETCQHLFVSNSSLDTSQQHGLLVQGAGTSWRAWFTQVWFGTNTFAGAVIGGIAANSGFFFKGCQFINNGQSGITFSLGSDYLVADCQISGNSLSSPNTYDGIVVNNSVTKIQILGNKIKPFEGFTNTQRYGIQLVSGCDDFIINDNDLTGNGTGSILNSTLRTANQIIRDNRGYLTSTRGTATITVGTAVVGQTHGLPFTPAAPDISALPINGLAGIKTIFVSTITGSGFNINSDVNTTGGQQCSWRIDAYQGG